MVLLDNSTRWNSIFLSINRAIQLKRRIDVFYYAHRDDLSKDTLSEEDWTYLEQAAFRILESRVESSHPCLRDP
jgi:hypothetical protein